MSAIIRVIAVRDSRQFEEIGERWVPIPGSGQSRQCDRCQRDHEIHVEVALSDNTTAVIGQGCARGDSMEASVRRAVTSEITRARITAELLIATTRLNAAILVQSEVYRLPLPPVCLIEELPGDLFGERVGNGDHDDQQHENQ